MSEQAEGNHKLSVLRLPLHATLINSESYTGIPSTNLAKVWQSDTGVYEN